MMTPRSHQGDSELSLSQECIMYAIVGHSEVVVGTSIASYDLPCRTMEPTVRRRASAPNDHSHQPCPSHDLSTGDSELRLPQECIMYAMVDHSELVVGTSIATYDLPRRTMEPTVRRRTSAPPTPLTPINLVPPTISPQVILSFVRLKSVSCTR